MTHLDAMKKIHLWNILIVCSIIRYYPFGISCKLCEIEGIHSPVGTVNPLCTLHYVPISIPKTLTKPEKKLWSQFKMLIFSCRNKLNSYLLFVKEYATPLKLLFERQIMNFDYESQIKANQR